jgi:hypothetical protein
VSAAAEPTVTELLERIDRIKTDIAWYAAACYRDGATPTDSDHAHIRGLCSLLDETLAAAEAGTP